MIPRYTPIRRKRATPRRRKTVVRLTGEALRELRWQCWNRDNGRCVACGIRVYFEARFAGDPEAYDLAHVKSRGAGGDDSLLNTRTLCHQCHMNQHAGRL